jgi:hypothetical protein
MRKHTKTAASQFPLFPSPSQNQQLPREINPKLLLPLLVRLLRQHADRDRTVPRVSEANHE